MRVPREYELCDPTLKALRVLGGCGSIKDIAKVVISQMELPEELVSQPHGSGRQTELEYRLAWARTVLKECGFVNNPKRGVWALTDEGYLQREIHTEMIRRIYLDRRMSYVGSTSVLQTKSVEHNTEEGDGEEEFWREMTVTQFFAGYAEADSLYDPS